MKRISIIILLASSIFCAFSNNAAAQITKKKKSSSSSDSKKKKSSSSKSSKTSNSKNGSDDKKFIGGIGWGALFNYTKGPNFVTYQQFTNNDTMYDANGGRPYGHNLIFLGYDAIYILKEFSKESSISVSAFPTLGLGTSSRIYGNAVGSLNLTFPVFLNYNSRLMASYKSKSETGFRVGLGFETNFIPLINSMLLETNNNNDPFKSVYKNPTIFTQPCMQLGLSRYNKNDRALEWNLKIGYMPRKASDPLNLATDLERKTNSFSFRLSSIVYINY